MKPKSPCLNCLERHELCHMVCEKYISFRSALDAYNEQVRAKAELEALIVRYGQENNRVKGAKKRKK